MKEGRRTRQLKDQTQTLPSKVSRCAAHNKTKPVFTKSHCKTLTRKGIRLPRQRARDLLRHNRKAHLPHRAYNQARQPWNGRLTALMLMMSPSTPDWLSMTQESGSIRPRRGVGLLKLAKTKTHRRVALPSPLFKIPPLRATGQDKTKQASHRPLRFQHSTSKVIQMLTRLRENRSPNQVFLYLVAPHKLRHKLYLERRRPRFLCLELLKTPMPYPPQSRCDPKLHLLYLAQPQLHQRFQKPKRKHPLQFLVLRLRKIRPPLHQVCRVSQGPQKSESLFRCLLLKVKMRRSNLMQMWSLAA
mmetsp:Transcript_14465/g.26848  ORF Transcript_14465/g.26848 Transcript_14465/m.26848 type:complete len:301 (+) Transcript_14465:583-1485(+)